MYDQRPRIVPPEPAAAPAGPAPTPRGPAGPAPAQPAGTTPAASPQQAGAVPAAPQKPADLAEGVSFLGVGVGGGVVPTLRDRLSKVETHLRSMYDSLDPHGPERININTMAPISFHEWAGVTSVNGWQPRGRKHSAGTAVDVNATSQPYIATRTRTAGQTIYGGEAAGAALQTQRHAAIDVMDRAAKFAFGQKHEAELHAVPPGKVQNRTEAEAKAAYRRISIASSALSRYLSLALRRDPTTVQRRPIEDVENASKETLLAAIPLTERLEEKDALDNIKFSLPADWPLSIDDTYVRILRDYELVRVPMVIGKPEERPATTRNPTRGFLHLPEHFVVAMTRADVGGLRWGAVDFGAHESGDVHHFDLGYP